MTYCYSFANASRDFDYLFSTFICRFEKSQDCKNINIINLIKKFITLEFQKLPFDSLYLKKELVCIKYAFCLKNAYKMMYKRIYYIYSSLFYNFLDLNNKDVEKLIFVVNTIKYDNFCTFYKEL